MSYYHLTLQNDTGINHCVFGDFTGDKTGEFAVSTGRLLKLLRYIYSSKRFQTLHCLNTFSRICSLKTFWSQKHCRDLLVVTTDTGVLSILRYETKKKVFELIFKEAFSPSTNPSTTLGQHLAVSLDGRVILIGAMEKVQCILVLNYANDKCNVISKQWIVAKEESLIYDIVTCVSHSSGGYYAFASLESTYKELYSESIPCQRLVFIEVDINKQEKITIKNTFELEHRANRLITDPHRKGVIVCFENYIGYYRLKSSQTVKCSIPKRLIGSRGLVLIACSTPWVLPANYTNRVKTYIFVQTEQGDIFKIKFLGTLTEVNVLVLEYIDTIPVASALCVFGTDHLFAASEFGNHHVYKIIEKDLKILPQFRSFIPLGENETFLFVPHSKYKLVKVAQLSSLSPIMQMEIISGLSNRRPQLYLATGRGPLSTIKICNQALEVRLLQRYSISKKILCERSLAEPVYISIIGKNYVLDRQTLVIVSFWKKPCTKAFILIDGVLHKYNKNLFQTNTTTFLCVGIKKDVVIQICPEGAYLITNGSYRAIWNEGTIIDCAINGSALIFGTLNKEIVYFVLYSINAETVITPLYLTLEVGGHITCMSLSDGKQDDQFLAVGVSPCPCVTKYNCECYSNMHQIQIYKVVLYKMNIKFLYVFPVYEHCPVSSILQRYKDHSFSFTFGDKDGNLLTTKYFQRTGEVKVIENKYLGTKPIQFYRVCVRNEDNEKFERAILAVSNSAWLKFHSSKEFVPLGSNIPSVLGTCIRKRTFGIIHKNTFKVLQIVRRKYQFQPTSVSLDYTPKKFTIDPDSGNAIIIVADYNCCTKKNTEKKLKEIKKNFIDATESEETASSLFDAEIWKNMRSDWCARKWASAICIVNNANQKIVFQSDLKQDEAAVSLYLYKPTEDPANHHLLIGVTKRWEFTCNTPPSASIYSYKVSKEWNDLEFLCKTPVKGIPTVICSFKENLLIGIDCELCLLRYDPQSGALELKCKIECVPVRIHSLYFVGHIIGVADASEGIYYLLYDPEIERFRFVGESNKMTGLSAACVLSKNVVARAYKTGHICIIRLHIKNCFEVFDSCYHEKQKLSKEASVKEEVIASFHLGDIVLSLKPIKLTPKRCSLVYASLSGCIGILTPFLTFEECLQIQRKRKFPKSNSRIRKAIFFEEKDRRKDLREDDDKEPTMPTTTNEIPMMEGDGVNTHETLTNLEDQIGPETAINWLDQAGPSIEWTRWMDQAGPSTVSQPDCTIRLDRFDDISDDESNDKNEATDSPMCEEPVDIQTSGISSECLGKVISENASMPTLEMLLPQNDCETESDNRKSIPVLTRYDCMSNEGKCEPLNDLPSGSVNEIISDSDDSDFNAESMIERLEFVMRQELSLPVGRGYYQFRSTNFCFKNIIDGDFCELYLSLDREKQEELAFLIDQTSDRIRETLALYRKIHRFYAEF
ncbi:splicing factor 3B subunit 3 [Nephila pilipes]|uniref:Splicing factor 3B subunit 3 n=1 Tax=Nephila pilipes TaxID=299642 RepID=A0A8X6N6C8_NEPPI|nr:splicing factor 3B subunit 3 [Nephila pilipes]